MRKPVIAAFLAGAAFIAGTAVAATVTYTGSPYVKAPIGIEGYSKQSPTSGTLTFGRGQSEMQIGGSSTISTLTITLAPPAYAYDGQMNCFYSKPAITTLTLQATSPQTLNDAVTSTSATTRYCYLFSASNNTWDRQQ